MSATDRNRLDEEESPYLRQHADNPVNWQPWDEAAREAARERDVPIFLSVGYSACHWCHVMEEESFQDEGVARVLNEHFVPVKVDREERPDLDRLYQTVCQMVSGQGGWPLSVWLTPAGEPFHVGTYFPKEPKRGMPGFRQMLEDMVESWNDPGDRREIEQRAEKWTRALENELEETPEAGDPPGSEFLETAASTAVRAIDRKHGGFGPSGPKFPHPGRLHVLLRAYDRTGTSDALTVAEATFDGMANGGMYDQVGGGFHRYSTDRRWVVPHFEKMLYDNAELPRAYLAGYQVTGEERYARVARETFAFVRRELTHPDGGFYATLDAQSEGEEGKFYVWTPGEIDAAVEDSLDAELFRDRFGVTESGNFENGKTVLTLSESVESLAESHDLSESEVRTRLEGAREAVFEAREERVRPGRDEKVIAGWNGLMISALAEGAIVLRDGGDDPPEETDYAAQGARALEFVREHLWDEDERRLARRYKDGNVKGEGYLEDYAFLGRGALDLYQATGDVDHLSFALDLGRVIGDEFWDPDEGTLYFTPESGESLVARPQELGDQSTPSSTGVAAQFLLSLSHFIPDEPFAEVAERVVETHASEIESNPLQYPSLVLAADDLATGQLELTIVGEELPAEWGERIAEKYLPGRLLTRRPPDADTFEAWLDRLGLDDAPPIWADRTMRDDQPTIYTCRSFTCSPPQTDIDAALEWAEKLAP